MDTQDASLSKDVLGKMISDLARDPEVAAIGTVQNTQFKRFGPEAKDASKGVCIHPVK